MGSGCGAVGRGASGAAGRIEDRRPSSGLVRRALGRKRKRCSALATSGRCAGSALAKRGRGGGNGTGCRASTGGGSGTIVQAERLAPIRPQAVRTAALRITMPQPATAIVAVLRVNDDRCQLIARRRAPPRPDTARGTSRELASKSRDRHHRLSVSRANLRASFNHSRHIAGRSDGEHAVYRRCALYGFGVATVDLAYRVEPGRFVPRAVPSREGDSEERSLSGKVREVTTTDPRQAAEPERAEPGRQQSANRVRDSRFRTAPYVTLPFS